MAFKATQAWYAGAALGAVGVLGAGYLLLVSPQLSNASDVTAQKDTVAASNVRAEAQLASLKQQFAGLPDLEAKVASMQVHLPTAPEEPTLLRQLSSIASSTGVKIVSAGFTAPQPLTQTSTTGAAAVTTPGTLSQIGLNVQVTGTFAQTRSFLLQVETLPRYVLVTGINVSRTGGGATQSGSSSASTSSSSANTLTTAITARTFMVGDASGGAATSTTTSSGAGTAGTAS